MDAAKKAEADELLEKLTSLLATDTRENGTYKTFDEIEMHAIEVGDRVSALLMKRAVQQGVHHQPQCPTCPRCDSPGKKRDEPEPRVIDAARGEVAWNENEYFCRKCRKSFFPSDRTLRLKG